MSRAVNNVDTGQSPDVPAWHRLPAETAEAYSRFRYFISLGAGRQLIQVARDLDVNYPAILDMAKKNNWLARAAAFEEAALDVMATRTSEPVMKKYQDQVVGDAFDSYNKLVLLWDQVISTVDPSTVDAYTLSSLVNARDKIDAMGRRAARLPSTFKPIEDAPKEVPSNQPIPLAFDDVPKILTLDAGDDRDDTGETGT